MHESSDILIGLLDTALDLPPEARDRWLDSLPSEHERLRPRLRALLVRAARIETKDFLETLPKLDIGASSESPGDDIGPYRLVREIGAGGMGAVWLAERHDGALKRAVALKFLRAHGPRDALTERLARERDILAGLVHPGIARLYDAGVSREGLPYLALEYVEGEHIDQYCRTHDLDVRARLLLFVQVAKAVAYAHSKLVVHRDLKPSNILVSRDGQVHLLDFGIAKLLEDGRALETRLTQLSGRALTPEYASPEQILGEPITTASDAYSLGVILYELLTDSRPYRLKRNSRGALEDAIVEVEPGRPSELVQSQALRRALRGDLDAIVSKALKKRPEDRYMTVNALAEDVERHLQGRPVTAQPDRVAYRLTKFVKRNRLPVGAAAIVLLAIVTGAGASFSQMLEAGRQRDAAVVSQQRAQAFSEFMKNLLQDAGPGRPLTATELLDRGAQVLERQQEMDESVAAYMRYEISRNYLLFNEADRELAMLERSAEGARRIGDPALLAAAQCSAAWSLARRGDRRRAEAALAEAERALANLTSAPSFTLADCLRGQSAVLAAGGDHPAAIAVLEKGLAVLKGRDAGTTWPRDLLMTQLADLYRATDRFRDALQLSEESLRLVRSSGRSGTLSELSALNNHAGNLNRLGEVARAAEMYGQAFAWLEQNKLPGMQPVGFRSNYGTTLLRLGDARRAIEFAEADLMLSRNAGAAASAALCDYLASRALLQLGRVSEARDRLRAAEALWQTDSSIYARMLREAAVHRAHLLLSDGQLAHAREAIDAALAASGYPVRMNAPGLDRALRLASEIHRLTATPQSASLLATDALEISSRIARDPRQSADVGLAALLRAEALAEDRGGLARALEDAALATDALRNGYGADHADTLTATRLLARLRVDAERP